MKHIVVDLEMNRVASKHTKESQICGSEIIEIGAVVLDEHYREIGAFKTLVKPQYNEVIEKHFAKLTGITTEMVADAPVFDQAIKMFFSWCHSLNDEVQIYQWSGTDLDQVRKELLLKGTVLDERDRKLLKSWEDFQKEYSETLHMTRALSLKDAVMYANVEFVGRAHDALFDARNTAVLLQILRTPELREEKLGHVIEAFDSKPCSSTLGDLFNFAALGIGA